MDDESLLYFPGVFLTGKVVLELEEDTPILGEFRTLQPVPSSAHLWSVE